MFRGTWGSVQRDIGPADLRPARHNDGEQAALERLKHCLRQAWPPLPSAGGWFGGHKRSDCFPPFNTGHCQLPHKHGICSCTVHTGHSRIKDVERLLIVLLPAVG